MPDIGKKATEFERQIKENRQRVDVQRLNNHLKVKDAVVHVQILNKGETKPKFGDSI